MSIIFVLLAAAALFLVVAGVLITRLITICQPNEVLIFSGAKRMTPHGEVGYRLVHGGRAVRLPLFEKVSRLDLTNMIIHIRVDGAYSRGGIPLSVAGVANVKIASSEPTLSNAIERFLGKTRQEIMQLAQETLEGNLRGVLATLTPEEVNQDRVKFAQSLLSEADADLRRLGLVLDTLKIQNVSDDKGYLDSIGRKQSADLGMRSRIAEAENRALSAERAADNLQNKEIARLSAEASLNVAETERRITEATASRAALIAEQQAEVHALLARAHAEVEAQRARAEKVRLQLEADRIQRAEAHRQALVSSARGAAAKTIEDARASATGLACVAEAFRTAGPDARRMFLMERANVVTELLMATVKNVPIERFTVVGDGGSDPAGKAGAKSPLLSGAAAANTAMKGALGIDVPSALGALVTRTS